jgi:hypothetical protein
LYNDTHIYFVFRWRDKTRNDRMGRWLYTGERWQAEAEWSDALALHWQATAKVDDFGQGGCAVLCHNSGRFREFPRMATRQEGALVDEWYWNAFTAEKAGRPGDGFLDHRIRFIPSGSSIPVLRYILPETSAAHGSDDSGARMPETVGGIPLTLNAKETEDGQPTPIFYVEQGRRMPLQSAGGAPREKWLPLYATGAPEGGDSEDIRGESFWSDGYWTLEFTRSLRTSSKRDVQLQPSEKSYSFGLAVWDGAAGQKHQVATVVRLDFEPIAEAR